MKEGGIAFMPGGRWLGSGACETGQRPRAKARSPSTPGGKGVNMCA